MKFTKIRQALKTPFKALLSLSPLITQAAALNRSARVCSAINEELSTITEMPTLTMAIDLEPSLKNFQYQKDATLPKKSEIFIAVEGDKKNALEIKGESVPILQRVTENSLHDLVENFSDPLLIDLDHSSENKGSTEAAGWVTKLTLGPDHNSVIASVEWTPMGVEKLQNKQYRYVSPVYLGQDIQKGEDGSYIFTVNRLKSVALTNRPNIKELGEISLNSAQLPSSDQPKQDNMKLTKITLDTLGLSEGATEQEVEAAAVALNSRAAAADTKVETLETENAALLNSARDAEMARFPNALKTAEQKEAFEILYAANSELAVSQTDATEKAIISAQAAPSGNQRTPQYSAANSKAPDASLNTEEKSDYGDEAIALNAVGLAQKEGISLTDAYDRVKAEQGK